MALALPLVTFRQQRGNIWGDLKKKNKQTENKAKLLEQYVEGAYEGGAFTRHYIRKKLNVQGNHELTSARKFVFTDAVVASWLALLAC